MLIKLTQSQNNYSNLHFYCSTLVFNIYFLEFAKLLGGPGPPRPLPTLRHCIDPKGNSVQVIFPSKVYSEFLTLIKSEFSLNLLSLDHRRTSCTVCWSTEAPNLGTISETVWYTYGNRTVSGVQFGLLTKPDDRTAGVRIAHCRNVRGLGKSMVVFSLFKKPRHSNERSTKFESLEQEQKYFEEENGKMIALQISPKIESLYGLGRQA